MCLINPWEGKPNHYNSRAYPNGATKAPSPSAQGAHNNLDAPHNGGFWICSVQTASP